MSKEAASHQPTDEILSTQAVRLVHIYLKCIEPRRDTK